MPGVMVAVRVMVWPSSAATHRRQSEAAHAWCDGGRACDGVAVISSDPPQMMEAAHDRV